MKEELVAVWLVLCVTEPTPPAESSTKARVTTTVRDETEEGSDSGADGERRSRPGGNAQDWNDDIKDELDGRIDQIESGYDSFEPYGVNESGCAT